jgi:L-threonylcarbamoyladenylate synthase
METRLLPTDPAEAMRSSVAEAVSILERGDVVALPTETVYGLAGDITSPQAIARIFEAKERPSFDPLIVHIPRKDSLYEVAVVDDATDKLLRKLMQTFWPGPLTFILPKHPDVSDAITAGLPTVAVRMTSDPIFKRVLHELGRPLAAPSANRFGRISPTSASAALEELDGRIPLVLDGGACSAGLESTILKIELTEGKPLFHILRHGPVTTEDLKPIGKIVKKRKPLPHAKVKEEAAPALEAPGQTDSHYAPSTPLRLLNDPDEFQPEPGKRYALLSYRGLEDDGYLGLTDFVETFTLSPGSGKVPEAAVRLFFLMRQADQLGVDEIIAEPVPEHSIGSAIMDRLRRAATK